MKAEKSERKMILKPSREELFSEDYFCPLAAAEADGNSARKGFPTLDFQVALEEETSSIVEPFARNTNGAHQYCTTKPLEGEPTENGPDQNAPALDLPDESVPPTRPDAQEGSTQESIDMSEFGSKVEDAITVCALSANSSTAKPELADIWTNTSQSTLMDACAGNSQVEMHECATGMSEPLTIDCAIQTSQCLLMENESVDPNENGETVNQKKTYVGRSGVSAPVVFPRVSIQTSGPQPLKRPRFNESVVLAPIYTSPSVSYDFKIEADKENSFQNPRGENVAVGRRTSIDAEPKGSFYESHKYSKSNNEEQSEFPSSQSAPLRGPFLRIGLSKSSRSRKPLHAKIFGKEQNR